MEHSSFTTIREVHYPPLGNRPMELLKSCLYQDSETLQLSLMLRLHNKSQSKITACYVNWCGFDNEVNLLSAKRMEPCENLNVSPDETVDVTIPVPSLCTTSMTATIGRVVFADGTQWEPVPEVDAGVTSVSSDSPVSADTASLLFTPDEGQRPAARKRRDDVWEEARVLTPEEQQRRKRRRRSVIWIGLILILALLASSGYAYLYHRQKDAQYIAALELYHKKDFAAARDGFSALLGNRQAESYPADLLKYYGLSCVHTKEYAHALWAFGALEGRADGDTYLRQLNAALTGIVSAGERHTLGLTLDGEVLAAGDNTQGQCKVDDWSSVITVAAGWNHSLGLLDDGSVVATGENGARQCTVDAWTNVIGIAAGGEHSLGVRADGSVIASGDNTYNQCNVFSWSGIVAVAAGKNHSVGLRQNGTVIATGETKTGACNVGDWENIVAISAGDGFTVGVRSDGTVIATGDNTHYQCATENSKDIVSVAAGGGHTLLLTRGGRLQAIGDNDWRQGDISLWKNLLAVCGGLHHSAGIAQDGSAYAAGDNKNGQCDLSLWSDMGLPDSALAATAFPLLAD